MRHVWSIAVCALVAGLAGPLQAQSVESPFEYIESRHSVGVIGGYLHTDTGERDVGSAPAAFLGARYGIHLTGPLFGEVRAAFSPSERTLYQRPVATDPALAAVGTADAALLLIQAGLRFSLTGPRTWNGLAPYIVAAGGIATDLAGTSTLEAEIDADQRFDFGPAFAAGAGVGADFFLGDRFSIRAEASDHLWRLGYPIGLTEGPEEDSEWVHNFGISIGGAFHF